jgi:hypothetical protein
MYRQRKPCSSAADLLPASTFHSFANPCPAAHPTRTPAPRGHVRPPPSTSLALIRYQEPLESATAHNELTNAAQQACPPRATPRKSNYGAAPSPNRDEFLLTYNP